MNNFLRPKYEHQLSPETSPIEHMRAFVRPLMHRDQVLALINTIWQAGVSHGTKMSDQAHAILDEPEYRITEYLRFPVKIEKDVNYPTRKSRMDNFEWPELAKIIELPERKIPNIGNFRKFK